MVGRWCWGLQVCLVKGLCLWISAWGSLFANNDPALTTEEAITAPEKPFLMTDPTWGAVGIYLNSHTVARSDLYGGMIFEANTIDVYSILRLGIWSAVRAPSDAFHLYLRGHVELIYGSNDFTFLTTDFTEERQPQTALGYNLLASTPFWFQGLFLWGTLETFYISGNLPLGENGHFYYQIGRFRQTDLSEYILRRELLDGISFHFFANGFVLSLNSGFSGLIDKRYSSLWIHPGDYYNALHSTSYFTLPKLIGRASLGWVSTGRYGTSFLAEYTAYYDFIGFLSESFWLPDGVGILQTAEVVGEGVRSTVFLAQYVTAKLEGMLVPRRMGYLFGASYLITLGPGSLYVNTETNTYQAANTQAYMGFGELSFFLGPQHLLSSLYFRGLYSSGDPQSLIVAFDKERTQSTGVVTQFNGFFGLTRPHLSGAISVFSLNNLSFAEIEYRLTSSSVEWNLKGAAYFRSTMGPVNWGKPLLQNSSYPYLGVSAETFLKYKYYQHLTMSLGMGVFIPNPIDLEQSSANYNVFLQFGLSAII